jgi:hypothetical protein
MTPYQLANLQTLYVLTCQIPGATPPHGLTQYKVRALTPAHAADLVLHLHPSWTILATRVESTDGTPVHLGATMATEMTT